MANPIISLDAQLECVMREIGFRERVYPRLVAAKKMTQAKADHEQDAMQAVLETLLAKKPQQGMF